MLVTDDSVSIRLAKLYDLAQVKEFLLQANLPVEKIEEKFDNFILLFDLQSKLIGCAGLEIYNSFGLIRSVAIAKSLQNKKLGSLLVNNIEELARKKEILVIYLLTETAERFFTKHGYNIVSRNEVPEEIQNSFEYASSCKVSALVMKKNL